MLCTDPLIHSHLDSDSYKSNDSNQLMKIFYSLDQKTSKILSIFEIGHGFGIPNKRLYETINIVSVLGACTKHEGSLYTWHGLSRINKEIQKKYSELEQLSFNKSLSEIFNIGKSPSMEDLTLGFLRLCFFLGQSSINIQEVTTFFSSFGGKRDSILRRVYCIARVMKILGLIHHPHYRSDFIIKLNLKEMAKEFYHSFFPHSNLFDTAKIFLLNKINDNFINDIHIQRQSLFQNFLNSQL